MITKRYQVDGETRYDVVAQGTPYVVRATDDGQVIERTNLYKFGTITPNTYGPVGTAASAHWVFRSEVTLNWGQMEEIVKLMKGLPTLTDDDLDKFEGDGMGR